MHPMVLDTTYLQILVSDLNQMDMHADHQEDTQAVIMEIWTTRDDIGVNNVDVIINIRLAIME